MICNHMGPWKETREAEERIREMGSVSCCWLCRWWGGAMSQGMWEASISWRRQGNGFCPEPPDRNAPYQQFDLSHGRPVWDFQYAGP